MSTPQELREQADRAETKTLTLTFPASQALYLREALDNAHDSYQAWVWSHPEGETDEYVKGRDVVWQLYEKVDALIRDYPWETLGPDGIKEEAKRLQRKMCRVEYQLRDVYDESEYLLCEADYDDAAREYRRLLDALTAHGQEL